MTAHSEIMAFARGVAPFLGKNPHVASRTVEDPFGVRVTAGWKRHTPYTLSLGIRDDEITGVSVRLSVDSFYGLYDQRGSVFQTHFNLEELFDPVTIVGPQIEYWIKVVAKNARLSHTMPRDLTSLEQVQWVAKYARILPEQAARYMNSWFGKEQLDRTLETV